MKKFMNFNTLEDIVNFAFSMQTIGEHAKPDVKVARAAYRAYLETAAPETFKAFKLAVATCVENGRSGFDKVANKLKELESTQVPKSSLKK